MAEDNRFIELENKVKKLDDLLSLHKHDGGTSQKLESEETTTGWVSLGDVSTSTSLTQDDNWNDLDLSTLVPAGTKWVKAQVTMIATSTNLKVRFRPSGYTLSTAVYNPTTSSSANIDLEVIDQATTYNADSSLSSVSVKILAYQL